MERFERRICSGALAPILMSRHRIGFVMEQTLGHVTHDRNLRRWAGEDCGVVPQWMPVEFEAQDRWQSAPIVRGNWSLRASLRARAMVAGSSERERFDGLFFHTQVTALFSTRFMRRIPTVVSMDATPLNLDSVGRAYGHRPSGNRALEALKNALNRRTFRSAARLVTWCHWAKESLIRDYGVPSDKIAVIPPGVDLELWKFDREKRPVSRSARLLFVGADFRRKGGEQLLAAFRAGLADRAELDIVTGEGIDAGGCAGVRIHNGITGNSPELLALFDAADIFVFPTLGDCLPIAVMEAMAAGLPVVASDVGAISEEVDHGVTGFLIPSNDREALVDRVDALASSAEMRRQMGIAGRKRAEELFDGGRNYRAVLDACKECADGRG